ncbi:MAG: hypothetical protein ACXWV0_09955 [Flavisolibacter sp.]
MKKILLAGFALVCSMVAIADDPGVDEKVLAAFNKTFQQAEDVSWTTTEDHYQVKFTQHSIASRVYYDMAGNITKTYRYYKEENLPLLVLAKVKTKYTNQEIHGVTEVSSDSGTYYYIMLKNTTHWTEIKSDSYGALKLERKFRQG